MNTFKNQNKNLMILGICPDQFPFIQELLDDGHRIIFCERDQINIDKLSSLLSDNIYDNKITVFKCDLADKDKLLDIATHEKVDALIPVPLGKVISTVGYINSCLNLPGVSYEACLNFIDKQKVYELLKQNNLNCASQWNATELNKITFPCIVKPRFGCGSRGVKVANNYQELVDACEFCKKDFFPVADKDILIEEVIEGDEYSCDFFVKDDRITLYLLLKKTLTEFPYRQEITYEDTSLTNKEKGLISNYVCQCAKVLKINNTVVNCDLILSPKGPYIIDIASRFPGNYVCCVAKAKGEDLGRMYLDFIFNKKLPKIHKNLPKAYFSMFNLDNGELVSVPENVNTTNFIAENNLKVGDKITKVTNGRGLLSRGFALSLDNDIEHAKQKVNNYLKQFIIKPDH